MPLAQFDTVAAARQGFEELIDAAHAGGAGVVHRAGEAYAVVPVELVRSQLLGALGVTPEIFREEDGVGLVLPGMPFASEGTTLDDAAADMVHALREYAENWPTLSTPPTISRWRCWSHSSTSPPTINSWTG